MKKISETLLTVVITFAISLFIHFVLQHFTQPKGKILLGPTVKISEGFYLPIDIHNYSPKTLQHIKISVPRDIDNKRLISSSPVKIETISTNGELKILKISEIKANSITRITIPLNKKNDDEHIKIFNAKSEKIFISPILLVY